MRSRLLVVILSISCLGLVTSCKRDDAAPSGDAAKQEKSQQENTEANDPNDDPVDKLIEQLKSSNADQRVEAIILLSEKTDHLDTIIKPILTQLSHPDTFVIYAANRVVEKIAPVADNQIDRWIKSDENRDVAASAELLRKLGPKGAKYIDRLRELLRSESYVKRMSALFVIEEIGASAAPAIPEILPLLEAEEPNERFGAMRCLGSIGSKDEKVIKALIANYEKGLFTVRSYASLALAKIGDAGDYDLVSEFIKRTKKFNAVEKEYALKSLGILGKDTPAIREAITKSLSDRTNSVYAAVALWKVTGEAQASLDQLKKDLKDIDKNVAAIDGCGEMGKDAAPLIDELIKIGKRQTAGGEEAGYRLYVMEALIKIGPTDERVHAFLNECAQQKYILVNWMAKQHLSKLEKSQ